MSPFPRPPRDHEFAVLLLLRTCGDILLWKLPTECGPTCPQTGLDSSDILRELVRARAFQRSALCSLTTAHAFLPHILLPFALLLSDGGDEARAWRMHPGSPALFFD